MPRNPDFLLQQDFTRNEAHDFDVGAFTDAIQWKGVPLVHHRAMACPVGMVHKDDTNLRIHTDHPKCSNGFIYQRIGNLPALFMGNASNATANDTGFLDGSTVQVTLPRQYDDVEREAFFAPFDRLYLADERQLWPHWEIIEHNPSGIDRLRWPAVRVENVMDNRGVEYKMDVDFTTQNGKLVWLDGGQRPGVDMDTDEKRGRVCTVWYVYQPYFYIQRLMHDGRMVQNQEENGGRKVVRLPFQALLVREFVYENVQARDTGTPAPDDPSREMRGPEKDGYPPG